MVAVSRAPAGAGDYATNKATCGYSSVLDQLVCAGYNSGYDKKQGLRGTGGGGGSNDTAYGVVGFVANATSMTSTLLGKDPRTVGWEYGFGENKFAVLQDGKAFVMLAQPNLGMKRHSELFVTEWDPTTKKLSAVSAKVLPALDDGNMAWAVY
jgi:hypothetical protein